MFVLGIETSCDETAAAVVTDGVTVEASAVSSSLALHKQYGGIVPEIAFRRQLESIAGVVDCALKQAGVPLARIGLISVTDAPGLIGSLLVGTAFAEALSYCCRIPLVKVNHLHSHIYSPFIGRGRVRFPFMSLVVSGGHTSLFEVRDFSRINLLGATTDDACGEAFDKVAKILRLGYPGGPVIERLARAGDPAAIRFRCSRTGRPLDFSFSGIKTAVLYFVQKNLKMSPGHQVTRSPDRHERRKSQGHGDAQVHRPSVADVCASFQEAALGVLVEKSIHGCRMKGLRRLAVGGGVAANTRLRALFQERAGPCGIEVFFPERQWCTDNAAMVAGLGYWRYNRGGTGRASRSRAKQEEGYTHAFG